MLALRLAVLLAWSAVACRAPAAKESSAAHVEVWPLDADVWQESVMAEVRVVGHFQPQRCEFWLGATPIRAQPAASGFAAQLRLVVGVNRVTARCVDESGQALVSDPVSYVQRATVLADAAPANAAARDVAWLDRAVFYGVYPPLFGTPALRSVTDSLPRLAELGITTLWVSPLSATPKGNYGYAVTDYFEVRNDYGTSDDLKVLVARAHELGLRVVFDFVPNHTSEQHPYFVQTTRHGRRSHYYHFYARDAQGTPLHYFDWRDLPNLDYANPEVPAWMTAASRHWIESYRFDGIRVDAAWGVAERQPSFYPQWTRRMIEVNSQIALIAEASARDPYYLDHGFDAAYDWTNELGRWAWAEAFDSHDQIVERLRAALAATAKATKRNDRVLRFLNNNDTGARFVTRHGVGLTRAATAALLTLPGIPCLFSFDEVGGEFEPYAEAQRFQGKQHPELFALHKQLIATRLRFPALHGPGLELLSSSNPAVLAYLRENGADAALVVINFSGETQLVQLPMRAPLLGRRLTDLAAPNKRSIATQPLPLALNPYAYAILVDAEREAGGRD